MRIITPMLLLTTLVPAALLARAQPAVPASATAAYETADPGQKLFVRQGCYLCHGLVGQGSNQSGPALTPLRLSAEGFAAYVRRPRGVMPPYRAAVLSDADLGRIEAYVRSLRPGQPYAQIPLLAATVPATSGKGAGADPSTLGAGALYAQTCAACHGVSREGGVGPTLKEEGRKHDAAAIAQIIKAPPPRMPRLYPDPLSAAQVESIAAWLAQPHQAQRGKAE